MPQQDGVSPEQHEAATEIDGGRWETNDMELPWIHRVSAGACTRQLRHRCWVDRWHKVAQRPSTRRPMLPVYFKPPERSQLQKENTLVGVWPRHPWR